MILPPTNEPLEKCIFAESYDMTKFKYVSTENEFKVLSSIKTNNILLAMILFSQQSKTLLFWLEWLLLTRKINIFRYAAVLCFKGTGEDTPQEMIAIDLTPGKW